MRRAASTTKAPPIIAPVRGENLSRCESLAPVVPVTEVRLGIVAKLENEGVYVR